MQGYKPEQIVTMLRQIEVGIANGNTTSQACKEAAITVQTFYRWRKEFGGARRGMGSGQGSSAAGLATRRALLVQNVFREWETRLPVRSTP